mgnify:CR=1 FL=1
MLFRSDGSVVVADAVNHRIRKVAADGTVTTLAGSGNAGLLDGTGTQAWFNTPADVAQDGKGVLYVADRDNAAIRKIDAQGAVTTLAGGVVGMLDASFMQQSNHKEQEVTQAKGASLARYGANLLPIDDRPTTINSPLMRYPYDQTRKTLEFMKNNSDWDACHGIRMRYAHPQTGDWVLPTMGPAIQLVPKGFTTKPYRSTDGAIVAVAEGRGTATFGDKVFQLSPQDVFVVPAWAWRSFKAEDDLVLFHVTDRPVQEKLGLWREDRGAPA